LYRVRTEFIQSSYRVRTEFIQSSYRVRTEFIKDSYRVYIVRAYIEFINSSHC